MKILFAISAYLFGSIPSGYIFFRLSEHKDIRRFGSQSTGATNVLRLKGWKYALPVLLIDFAKGFLPVLLGFELFADKNLASLSAFLAVLGHCFPIYIKFRGGKGLATAMGAYACFALKPFLLSLALFLLAVAISRYVSLGSILAAFSFPFFVLFFKGEVTLLLLSGGIFLVIFLRHLDNVKRLAKGEERKLGKKMRIENS